MRRVPRGQTGPAHVPGQESARAPRKRRRHISRVSVPEIDPDRLFDAALTPAARALLAEMDSETALVTRLNLARAVRAAPSLAALRALTVSADGVLASSLPLRWPATLVVVDSSRGVCDTQGPTTRSNA